MTAEFGLAVHALVYLFHTQRVTSSQELAENICTNPARVRKVMAKLHRHNLLQAAHGQGSGFITNPDGDSISLKIVLMALEETPISMNWRSGDMDKECLISSGMGSIMDTIYGQMNEECIAFLDTITIGSINSRIFNR